MEDIGYEEGLHEPIDPLDAGMLCGEVRAAIVVRYNTLSTEKQVERAKRTIGDHPNYCSECAAYERDFADAARVAADLQISS